MNCKIFKGCFKRKVFGFAQVEANSEFSEKSPLFVVQEIPDRDIPEEMKIFKEKTGRKIVKDTKKLLGFMKAKKDSFVHPLD